MNAQQMTLKARLESAYTLRNNPDELCAQKPDPLLVVHRYKHSESIDKIAIVCALLAYGNAHQIVRTLGAIPFELFASPRQLAHATFPLYRFQTAEDIRALCMALAQIPLRDVFCAAADSAPRHLAALHGIAALQRAILSTTTYRSRGFDFLVGLPYNPEKPPRAQGAFKRWNLFLRWAIRKDCLDLGFWEGAISTAQLFLPLDTHTSTLCVELGILERKANHLQAVFCATDTLARLNPHDPIKYDFALYRIGQERR